MKKAFTLVEILAVIVILGVILTLVSTNVLNIFTSSKQKAYNNQLETLKDLSKQYATEFSYDIIWNSGVAEVTIGDLINVGYIEEDIINAKNNLAICPTSFITITNTNNVFTYDITIYNTGDPEC